MRISIILLALFLLGCDKAPIQVRSSEIKDEAIAEPKLSSCGVGILFDQKTGDTVAIMYKGKQFVPAGSCSLAIVKEKIEVGHALSAVYGGRADQNYDSLKKIALNVTFQGPIVGVSGFKIPKRLNDINKELRGLFAEYNKLEAQFSKADNQADRIKIWESQYRILKQEIELQREYDKITTDSIFTPYRKYWYGK